MHLTGGKDLEKISGGLREGATDQEQPAYAILTDREGGRESQLGELQGS